MTEQTQVPTALHDPAAPVAPAIGGRRRPRTTVAALGVLIAVAAGSTGALAATMVRRSDATPTPVPAVASGPSVYIPGAAGAAGGGGGVVAGGGVAAAGPVAVGAPAGAAIDVAGSGASFAGPGAVNVSGIGGSYPGAAWCSGSAPAQVTGREVTATGMSQLAGIQPASSAYSLWAGVSNQGGGDTAHAVSAVQARLAAISDALVRAGVARGSIHASSVSVYAGMQKNALPPGIATGTPAAPTVVNASASLSATVADAATLDRAVAAAAGAGADSVNASTQWSAVTPPPADQVSAAIAQATDQARTLAGAGAKAAGGSLGALHSVTAQPPTVCGWGQDGPQFVVAVTVSWDLA